MVTKALSSYSKCTYILTRPLGKERDVFQRLNKVIQIFDPYQCINYWVNCLYIPGFLSSALLIIGAGSFCVVRAFWDVYHLLACTHQMPVAPLLTPCSTPSPIVTIKTCLQTLPNVLYVRQPLAYPLRITQQAANVILQKQRKFPKKILLMHKLTRESGQ